MGQATFVEGMTDEASGQDPSDFCFISGCISVDGDQIEKRHKVDGLKVVTLQVKMVRLTPDKVGIRTGHLNIISE